MDSLDFAVYRFLSPGGEARFWAGRRLIDPRITPREIAERLGVSESSVRTRQHHLAQSGFLRDRRVVPNPSLFGQRVFVVDLLVRESAEVDRILRDLTLVESVLFARDIMDEDERKIQVHFASESDSTASLLGALLGQLSPAGRRVVAQSYYIPACDRELSPLDWRVLQAVWRNPDTTFAELAGAVRISVKTAARSYHQLIDSRACWWTHGPDSEEFPLALVRAEIPGPEDRGSVLEWIRTEARDWMPAAKDGLGLEPDRAATVLAGLVPADVPAVLERFLRKLASVEGVGRVRRTFGLGSAPFSTWFADRIDAKVRGHS